MSAKLDSEFVVFAAPAMARELMRTPSPGDKKLIADFKDLLFHAQQTFEKELDDNASDESRELAEELFLQGLRDLPALTKENITKVVSKSFVLARALSDGG